MKVHRLLLRGERGQSIGEYVLLFGAIVFSMVLTINFYTSIVSPGADDLEKSSGTVADQLSLTIQSAFEEELLTSETKDYIKDKIQEVNDIDASYIKKDLTADKCVKVDIGGSAKSNFTLNHEQTIKIHRPNMHLKLSNFCDIRIETATLLVDGRVYWHFKPSFFDRIKLLLKRIFHLGKLKNISYHFYYRNIELDLSPGEHVVTFRWTGTAYAKSNSEYTGKIKAAVTSKNSKRVVNHLRS